MPGSGVSVQIATFPRLDLVYGSGPEYCAQLLWFPWRWMSNHLSGRMRLTLEGERVSKAWKSDQTAMAAAQPVSDKPSTHVLISSNKLTAVPVSFHIGGV